MSQPQTAILMGSDSDLELMQQAADTFKEFGVEFEIRVLSAHRCPDEVAEFAKNAEKRGIQVIIAGAGGAAHLAGVLAAHSTLPVIGVPIPSTPLAGFDSLLSTVQMPAGIPVATVAVGKSGARNAALLAVQILALADAGLKKKYADFKKSLAAGVLKKDKQVQEKFK